MKINFRQSARRHVAAAKEFAAIKDGKGLHAACLELRMAIEALTYENLQTYIAEVGDSVMEKWQPRKVISELLQIDPLADQSSEIAIGIEEEYGKGAMDMQPLGFDHKFTVKWAHKAHNSLGSFLHEPTIAQHKNGKASHEKAIKETIEGILAELEPILNTPVWGANFGVFVSFNCECGFNIKRKSKYLEAGKDVSCANCGRFYDYQPDGKNWHFSLSTMSFDCPGEGCSVLHTIGRHEARTGFQMICPNCGSKITVRSQLVAGVETPSEIPQPE